MALSDELLATFGREHGFGCTVADAGYHCDTLWYDGNPMPLMRAIEAEVRKDDEALIWQMLKAIRDMQGYRADIDAAIAAARARLGPACA